VAAARRVAAPELSVKVSTDSVLSKSSEASSSIENPADVMDAAPVMAITMTMTANTSETCHPRRRAPFPSRRIIVAVPFA
jgi:hypothetical protein